MKENQIGQMTADSRNLFLVVVVVVFGVFRLVVPCPLIKPRSLFLISLNDGELLVLVLLYLQHTTLMHIICCGGLRFLEVFLLFLLIQFQSFSVQSKKILTKFCGQRTHCGTVGHLNQNFEIFYF